MFKNEFATLCNAGKAKADFLEKNKVGYFVSALLHSVDLSPLPGAQI